MKTVNAMQLKARVKAQAQAANVSPQLMMQDYMLERLLERISLSEWRDNVVIKGGMLISSLIGVESRVTYDIATLWRTKREQIDPAMLRDSLVATCGKRGSIDQVLKWETVMSEVSIDPSHGGEVGNLRKELQLCCRPFPE